jgi:omega-hydroxy-beta-dihydromenaquinone-9 sulfotransferase
LIHSFSFERKSLRFFSPKRVIAVFLFLPIFLISIIINWFFFLLDELIFPGYRKLEIRKAAFIIGVPRSATTHLFNIMFHDQHNFHGFRLWELLFAPSICQKYFFLFVRWIDRRTGNPLYRLSLFLDRIIFGKFIHIHDMGLTKPEEDEVLFLYNLSSLFFFYFWPEPEILDDLFYHDTRLPLSVRRRNINFYYRCIQRHNYVFDRQGKKYFLSKNPTFIPRMESVAERFGQALFIYPLRTPYSTIPSTISLNRRLLSNFCAVSGGYPFIDETRDFVLEWYIIAERVLREKIRERGVTVTYDRIKADPDGLLRDLYRFLGLEYPEGNEQTESRTGGGKEYKSLHVYPDGLGIDKELINERLKGIVPQEMLINK